MAAALSLLRRTFSEFGRNDPLRLAGATAFFSTFALPAVVLIILHIARLVLSPDESNTQLYDKLNNFVGDQTSAHLITVMEGFEKVTDNWMAMIAGFIFIIFVATTLFKVIKNSLNQIFKVSVVAKISFRLTLGMRIRELIVVLAAGILFLFVLLMEGTQALAAKEFRESSKLINLIFSNSIGFVISVIVATMWFGLIFCFLPDGRIPVKTCFVGALLTSILFNTGKLLLKWILLSSNVNLIFGKSAAVVLLLLFVFYISLILYFGATFTKILAHHKNEQIKPLPHARLYELKEEVAQNV